MFGRHRTGRTARLPAQTAICTRPPGLHPYSHLDCTHTATYAGHIAQLPTVCTCAATHGLHQHMLHPRSYPRFAPAHVALARVAPPHVAPTRLPTSFTRAGYTCAGLFRSFFLLLFLFLFFAFLFFFLVSTNDRQLFHQNGYSTTWLG